jgi:hypothetical protein
MDEDHRLGVADSRGLSTKPAAAVREVEMEESDADSTPQEVRSKLCENCGRPGCWRFWIRRYLCDQCKQLPQYRTICRSRAMAKYGLTFDEMLEGEREGILQVFKVPNPHDKKIPMRLYFETELQLYATYLRQAKLQQLSAAAEDSES